MAVTAAFTATAVAAAWLAGCGSSSPPPEPTRVHGAVALDATPAGAGDAIVATVDGHPVYASCVAAQAAHDHTDARAALRACIDFELLARAAAAEHLDDDDEVRDALRTAMVNRVVERDFEDHVFQPPDFGALWDRVASHYTPLIDHDDFRASTYVRMPVAKGAAPEVDAAAHAVAEQPSRPRSTVMTGLTGPALYDLAAPIAAAAHIQMEHADVAPYLRVGLVKELRDGAVRPRRGRPGDASAGAHAVWLGCHRLYPRRPRRAPELRRAQRRADQVRAQGVLRAVGRPARRGDEAADLGRQGCGRPARRPAVTAPAASCLFGLSGPAARTPTPFGAILQRAVDAVPGAVGAAFAAPDGEMVDAWTSWDPDTWAILTAHYGVVLGLLDSALGTWHFGGPCWFVAEHAALDIVVDTVDGGYFALLALSGPRPLAAAIDALEIACADLRREMA